MPGPDIEPPPPAIKPPSIIIKSVVSDFRPTKMFKPSKIMSRGQDEFMRMLNIGEHVTDMKPIKLAPIRALVEKEFDKRPPIPLKSVMFKWPIIRMIFDKQGKRNKMFPMPPPPNIDPKEALPMKPPMRQDMFPPRNPKMFPPPKGGKFPPMMPSPERGYPRPPIAPPPLDRAPPSFRKDLKIMNQHQDKSHRMTSDPRNKVNLIQVFVNKPHNEASAKPEYHNTMIKKHQFSSSGGGMGGGEYQAPPHYGPMPPPGPYHGYQPHPYKPYPPPPPHMHQAPARMRPAPAAYDAPRHMIHSHDTGRYFHAHSHGHYHHAHPPLHPPVYLHRHGAPEPPMNNVRPSTSYPGVEDPEVEEIVRQVAGTTGLSSRIVTVHIYVLITKDCSHL